MPKTILNINNHYSIGCDYKNEITDSTSKKEVYKIGQHGNLTLVATFYIENTYAAAKHYIQYLTYLLEL